MIGFEADIVRSAAPCGKWRVHLHRQRHGRTISILIAVLSPEIATLHDSTLWTIRIFWGAGLTVGAMACTILSDPIRRSLGPSDEEMSDRTRGLAC